MHLLPQRSRSEIEVNFTSITWLSGTAISHSQLARFFNGLGKPGEVKLPFSPDNRHLQAEMKRKVSELFQPQLIKRDLLLMKLDRFLCYIFSFIGSLALIVNITQKILKRN